MMAGILDRIAISSLSGQARKPRSDQASPACYKKLTAVYSLHAGGFDFVAPLREQGVGAQTVLFGMLEYFDRSRFEVVACRDARASRDIFFARAGGGSAGSV